jgi:hypothetical protein
MLAAAMEHVDIPGKTLRLPQSKTGAKVAVGAKPGPRLTDLQPCWQRVRAHAGLKDVRIHDLRHSLHRRLLPLVRVASDD